MDQGAAWCWRTRRPRLIVPRPLMTRQALSSEGHGRAGETASGVGAKGSTGHMWAGAGPQAASSELDYASPEGHAALYCLIGWIQAQRGRVLN